MSSVFPFVNRALFGTKSSTTAPIQGLRVIAAFIITAGHFAFLAPLFLDHPSQAVEFLISGDTIFLVIYQVTFCLVFLAVDFFFFFSGFFFMSSISRLFGDDRTKPISELVVKRFRFPQYIVSRWMRLIPVHFFISCLFAAMGRQECISSVESIFMGNIFHAPEETVPAFAKNCVIVGWSLGPDFQGHLFILAILALLPTFSGLQKKLWFLSVAQSFYKLFSWIGAGKPLFPSYLNGMDFVTNFEQKAQMARDLGITVGDFNPLLPENIARRVQLREYEPFYASTSLRICPLLVGAAIWLAMRERSYIYRQARRFASLSVTFGLATIALYCYGSMQTNVFQRTGWLETVFECFGRLAISLAIGLIVMTTCSVHKHDTTCAEGRMVHGLQAFLSNRLFILASRGTYAVYLAHILFSGIVANIWPKISREALSHSNVLISGIQLYIVTLVGCIPLLLLEEFALGIRRMVISRLAMFLDKIENKSNSKKDI